MRTAKAPSESLAVRRIRTGKILVRLRREFPGVKTDLAHRSAFELLVATILSAQCTDERVNLVTPSLFRAFPSADALARAPVHQLESLIRSTGFFRNKAKNLIGCCRALVERHGGEVPRDMEALVNLPGVGRKTANVVLGVVYGAPGGVVVDTHVRRLSGRLGLTNERDPVKIESELNNLVPRSSWVDLPFLFIRHGRRTCLARRPACAACVLRLLCPRRGIAGMY